MLKTLAASVVAIGLVACGQAPAPAAGDAAPAAVEAPLSPEAQARILAMDAMQLNIAAGEADGDFAADLARYSNIAATAAVCAFTDVEFGPKLEARFAASTLDPEQKAVLRRFYETTLAADTASWAADPKEEVCTEENRQSVIRIHEEW